MSFFRRRPRPGGVSPADQLVEVDALGVRRGRVEALRLVDLKVRAGETVALMGRNGAGKSTLLNALVGTVTPTSGAVLVSGRVPHRTDPRELIRQVGLVPQEPRDLLYADTVAAECSAADTDAGAAPGTCRALVSELLPGVADDTHPRDLSEGQRLALALAVVLTGRPRSCSSTSRPAVSTTRPRPVSSRTCASWPPTATPSCSPRTTWSWPPSWRTGW